MDELPGNKRTPLSVFISYAHEDEPLRKRLEAHLSLLRRQGLIADWHDRQILAGKEWGQEIDEHLETASIILLLISPDFLASDYCYGVELQQALARQRAGKVHVAPILLRPVDLEDAPFAQLQFLPQGAKPVTLWENQDEALTDIAKGIRMIVGQLRSSPSLPHQSLPVHSLGASTTSQEQSDLFQHTTSKTIDTHEAINNFHQLMQPSGQMKVFRLVGESSTGKSHLLTKVFPLIAQQDYQARCAVLDLRNTVYTVPHILHMACGLLGPEYFNCYYAAYHEWISRSQAKVESDDAQSRDLHLTTQFMEGVGLLNDKPLLLLFDSVDIGCKNVQIWLMDTLIVQLSRFPFIHVVIAGCLLPDPHGSYAACTQSYRLQPITEEQEYITFCRHLNISIAEQSVRDFAYACDYIPGLFVGLVYPKFLKKEKHQ